MTGSKYNYFEHKDKEEGMMMANIGRTCRLYYNYLTDVIVPGALLAFSLRLASPWVCAVLSGGENCHACTDEDAKN